MRINKYLASSGVASRRKVEEYILNGRVSVNGKIVTNLATDVCDSDVVLFDNKPLKSKEKFEYYMLNKPVGYISSASDDRGRKIVTELIKTSARIYPVGRLDCDSEGLLLLTNDGDLTYKLTHPKNCISKTYIVAVNAKIDNDEIDKLKTGVTIDDYKLHKCQIDVLHRESNSTKLKMTIFEGRNREIRKMFESFGQRVIYLQRIMIQKLKMEGLKVGEYRSLTKTEIDYLKNL